MRRFWIYLVLGWFAGQLAGAARAEEFRLNNGDLLKGEIASATEDGLLVALEVGGFSSRVAWAKFTQETLKKLLDDPRAKRFVEPFIDVPLELKAKKTPVKKKFAPLKQPPRVDRPLEIPSLFAAMTTPAGVVLLVVLYAANLFAAFEIAIYRQRPIALVCGLSALLPFLGPVVFLSLPEHEAVAAAEVTDEALAEDGGTVPTGAEAASSSLSVTRVAKPSATLQPVTYNRGEYTFNRRFFETKFPGFFRVVPGEAEKDFLIVVKVPRNEYITRRISRITAKDIHLVLHRSVEEVTVSFEDVTQVEVRRLEAES